MENYSPASNIACTSSIKFHTSITHQYRKNNYFRSHFDARNLCRHNHVSSKITKSELFKKTGSPSQIFRYDILRVYKVNGSCWSPGACHAKARSSAGCSTVSLSNHLGLNTKPRISTRACGHSYATLLHEKNEHEFLRVCQYLYMF